MTFFKHIAEYERLYRALLGSRGSSWFVRKMRASLADMVTIHGHGYRLSADRPAPTFFDDLVPDLVSTMLVEAITWWLEQGRPPTFREMATRCALLMSAFFKEVSIWH